MTDPITSTNDAVLWAAIRLSWLEQNQAGYVVHDNVHYHVLQMTDGEEGFLPYTNRELFDSRSIIGSKPASYGDLDD